MTHAQSESTHRIRDCSPPLVFLENLHKHYTNAGVSVSAVRGISLTIGLGEFVAIMGASGSGKSTLMNILGCLDRPTVGRYVLDGLDVCELNSDQLADLRNRKLGFVFQGFNLLNRATALENVALPMICGARFCNRTRTVRDRAIERLAQVGLRDRANYFPSQLSGGQQQRVAIARALANEPDLVLADEPTGNLDSKTSVEIMGIFERLNENGMTIVMVTHDEQIARYCSRTLVIQDGQLVGDQPRPVGERTRSSDEIAIVGRRS